MIEIHNLRKSFGKLVVLDQISVRLETGQVTAVVGPNGSGKTTLIKSILGLIKPDAGRIQVNEFELNGDWQYRRHIGYMPQIARFPENLKVRELLFMVKDLREKPYDLDEELFHAFGLAGELDKSLGTLSGGTRQKVSAVIAFLFRPDILILDEPTAGLDPASSSKLKDKIFRERERGRTIVLTSHIMSEIEEMAEHIVFLYDGRIYFNGAVEQLKADAGEFNLERAIGRMMEQGVTP